MTNTVDSQENMITDLRENNTIMRTQLDSKTTELANRDSTIDSMTNTVDSQENMITDLRENNTIMRTQLDSTTTELANKGNMKRVPAWAIALFIAVKNVAVEKSAEKF